MDSVKTVPVRPSTHVSRRQHRYTCNHRQQQADTSGCRLLSFREPVRENCDKDDLVDAQNNLHQRRCEQGIDVIHFCGYPGGQFFRPACCGVSLSCVLRDLPAAPIMSQAPGGLRISTTVVAALDHLMNMGNLGFDTPSIRRQQTTVPAVPCPKGRLGSQKLPAVVCSRLNRR